MSQTNHNMPVGAKDRGTISCAQAKKIFNLASHTKLSQAQIGAKFGISQQTVCSILRGYMKFVRSDAELRSLAEAYRQNSAKTRARVTSEMEKIIKTLHAEGKSFKHIGKEINVSHNTAHRVVKGVDKRPKPDHNIEDPKIAHKYIISSSRSKEEKHSMELTRQEFEAIIKRGQCERCGLKNPTTDYGIDRVFSERNYHWGNCQCMCYACNFSKGACDPYSSNAQCRARVLKADNPDSYMYNPAIHPNRMEGSQYAKSKHGAKKRDLPFELTKAQYEQICQQPCHFCGRPSTSSNGKNGVDRIDSSRNIGYILSNCQPACPNCQLSKSDRSDEEFLAHDRQILSYEAKYFENVRNTLEQWKTQGKPGKTQKAMCLVKSTMYDAFGTKERRIKACREKLRAAWREHTEHMNKFCGTETRMFGIVATHPEMEMDWWDDVTGGAEFSQKSLEKSEVCDAVLEFLSDERQ